MNPYQIKVKAEEFGIGYRSALLMRQRYLKQQLDQGIVWMLEEEDMPDVMPGECLKKLMAVNKAIPPKESANAVTDEMIARAREVRVDTLIEFVRGKALAWCHDDNHPSLTFMTKIGNAWCPACHKYFDAITVQQHLTGQSFHDAVRTLCR